MGARAHARLSRELLAWYRRCRRDLPFRRTRDPYAIWVSEVMLQQTQVATVLPYYERWMQRFPDVAALARAEEDHVLAAWQGLGYYSRARRLQAAARVVVQQHGGKIPSEREALRALPGIGDYSAGAIASIAFGRAEPLVDGNVVRVLTRRFGLRGDPTRAPLKQALWELAAELVPASAPGDFNQALMELGATICTPKAPRCHECPWRAECEARQKSLVERLPELPERKKTTPVRAVAALIRKGDAFLLCRLPPKAPRWAGLWVLPSVELGAGESAESGVRRAARELLGSDVLVGERLGSLAHTITRFRITLEAYACRPKARIEREATRWQRVRELGELALPTPHKRLLAKIALP